jgi:hypothetical protein
MEAFAAALAAVGPDLENAAERVPKTDYPAGAHFHRSAGKTLWNLVAAEKHYYQEGARNHGHQDCAKFGKIT